LDGGEIEDADKKRGETSRMETSFVVELEGEEKRKRAGIALSINNLFTVLYLLYINIHFQHLFK
jgi:hypothetical protein